MSVWADLERKCLKGTAKTYEGRKVFVGNGKLLVNRDQVFRLGEKGVGVEMNQRKTWIIFLQPKMPIEVQNCSYKYLRDAD